MLRLLEDTPPQIKAPDIPLRHAPPRQTAPQIEAPDIPLSQAPPHAQAHTAPQITAPDIPLPHAPSRQTYEALTVVVLKEKLRERSLKVSGLKRELVDRLLEADARALEMV